MTPLLALRLTCFTLLVVGLAEPRNLEVPEESADGTTDALEKFGQAMESMRKTIGALARQMMLQQMFIEEKTRSDADSGVKQVRHNREGTRNYNAETHTSSASVVSIHDHSNNDRTVGMGEFVGVLNGVEFRTRHNDYRLNMPHTTSSDWHSIQPIPFPDVPPEVRSKSTVDDQIKEMREWFKAWKEQDHSVRDFRKYFKPVLCYMEGAWTTETEGKIDEPFESDRHFVDARSWFDLQEKVRFTSYTGRKDNLENFSFLPTTIINVTEDGIPQFSQWNYRIMCHPISRDLPLNRLRVIDELGPRMTAKRTYEKHAMTRAARFQLNPFDTDTWKEGINWGKWGILDELMSEVPGKDNYQGHMTDEAFDLTALSLAPGQEGNKLNVAKYHRWFKVGSPGAMGVTTRHRGFSDENLFMAMNTQPKAAGMKLSTCKRMANGKEVCQVIDQKWSYAIPLEIIYLTPLSKWNPYDIQYKGDAAKEWGKTVEDDRRNGGQTLAKAYNGTHSRKFYQTPVEFFSGNEVGSDAADTTKKSVGVLDKKGELRITKASGTRIFFPTIQDVGILRQRFPIMPVHGEGSAVWKELEALKDVVLKSKTFGYIYREPLENDGPPPTEPSNEAIKLETQWPKKSARDSENDPGPHTHEITLQPEQVALLKDKTKTVVVTSTTAAGHEHKFEVKVVGKNRNRYMIAHCDSKDTKTTRCWDHHGRFLIVKTDQ